MKNNLLFFIAVFVSLNAFAQIKDPVGWKYEAVKKSASTYELVITATVPKPWHIYSQKTGKGGPIPTKITINKNPLIVLNGGIKEVGSLEKFYDTNFKTEVLYYGNQVQFVQAVTVKGSVGTNITGTVNYMICDDTQCLPPTTKSFDVKLH
jgi:Disulphide bond corrector protein DsbC